VSDIRFNDHVLVLGSTQSGKSELLNLLASVASGGAQRALYDTKHEFALPETAAAHTVEEIDWTAPWVHYQPTAGDAEEAQRFFAAVHGRRRIITIVHELGDTCDFQPNRTPPALNAGFSKGVAMGQGIWGGSQRPFQIPSRAKSEAAHVFLFVPRFQLEDDLRAAALAIGRNPRELGGQLDEVQRELGDHAFLHFDRRDGTLEACEPLSEAERARIIVARPVLY
jgi:energy-coupling factor transporter ATP-binding protein EcfA2